MKYEFYSDRHADTIILCRGVIVPSKRVISIETDGRENFECMSVVASKSPNYSLATCGSNIVGAGFKVT